MWVSDIGKFSIYWRLSKAARCNSYVSRPLSGPPSSGHHKYQHLFGKLLCSVATLAVRTM